MSIRLDEARIRLLNINGGIQPTVNNTYNLGTSSLKWANVYATKFIGALNGNADSATKLTSSAGSSTQPIYFSDGKPVAITGTISNNSASADRLLYKSNHAEAASGTTASSPTEGLLYTNGLFLTGTYNDSNTPVSYGNIINIAGSGTGQLLCQWQGSDNVAGHLYYRSHRDTSTGGWSPWITILDSSNYNSYSPTLTGTGASGTWGISISGNAATATNTDKLDGYHEYSFLRWRDIQSGNGGTSHVNSLWSQIGIRQYNNALPDGMGDNATYTYGEVISLPGSDSRLEFWSTHSSSDTGDLLFRSGWGDDKKAWIKILNTANYTNYAATKNHTHDYLPLSGGTLTGPLYLYNQNLLVYTIDNEPSGTASYTYSHHALCLGYPGNDQVNWYEYGGIWNFYQSRQGTLTKLCHIDSSGIHGAVWNDYAEFRESNEQIKPGRVVIENGDDTLSLSNKRLQPGANIVSDTYGFAIGETSRAQTPIAVSGRVLAYPYETRDTFSAGDAVCSGPNGTVSKMTRDEIIMYPERIIGTVSAIPDYEVWGTGNVPVDGRIWIKVI